MAKLTRSKLTLCFCVLAAATIATAAAYHYRFRMKAIAWHLRHGDSTIVAGYTVPVPKGWFVEQDSADNANLWNAKTGESIWLRTDQKSPNFTLQTWADSVEKLNSPQELITGRRELLVAGEPTLCFETDLRVDLPKKSIHKSADVTIYLPSVQCKSVGPLEAMFFAGIRPSPREDYRDLYTVLASIRKQ